MISYNWEKERWENDEDKNWFESMTPEDSEVCKKEFNTRDDFYKWFNEPCPCCNLVTLTTYKSPGFKHFLTIFFYKLFLIIRAILFYLTPIFYDFVIASFKIIYDFTGVLFRRKRGLSQFKRKCI